MRQAGLCILGAARGRPLLPRSAPKVLVHEAGRRAREPAVGYRISQCRPGDVLKLDENGGVAIKVRNREEGSGLRGEHDILLAQAGHPNREDRPFRRGGTAEPLDVCLAEGLLPRETLPGDEPGACAVTFAVAG
jgi:hypothetical protein